MTWKLIHSMMTISKYKTLQKMESSINFNLIFKGFSNQHDPSIWCDFRASLDKVSQISIHHPLHNHIISLDIVDRQES